VAQVRQLLVTIDEYQQVEAQPAKNRLERDRKRQHLSELEESCETALAELQPYFAAVPSRIPPQDSLQPMDDACEQHIEEVETVDEQESGTSTPSQSALFTESVLEEEAQDSSVDVAQEVVVEMPAAPLVAELLNPQQSVLPDNAVEEDGDVADKAIDEADVWLEEEESADLPFLEAIAEEVVEAEFWLDDEAVEGAIEENAQPTAGDNAPCSDITPAATRPTDDDEYLWKMVEDGDLAGAYWLSQAMSKLDKAPAIPPDLLAAAQASAWLTAETVLPYAEDLRGIARRYQPDQTHTEHLLLGVAAALPPILLAPSSEMLDWLNLPADFAWLADFVTPIREFGFYGVGLPSDVLPGVTDVAHLEEQLRQVVAQANEWWATAPHRRRGFTRSVEIWHELIKPNGLLSEFLQPVLNNDPSALATVRAEIAHWQNSSYADNVIDDIDRTFSRTKKSKIDGSFRDYLKRGIDEACRHALAWARVREEIDKRAHHGGDWLAQQAAKLRVHLKQSLPEIMATLAELQAESQPLPQRAAAQVLVNALHHWREFSASMGNLRTIARS
jgi:hypothetical protein